MGLLRNSRQAYQKTKKSIVFIKSIGLTAAACCLDNFDSSQDVEVIDSASDICNILHGVRHRPRNLSIQRK